MNLYCALVVFKPIRVHKDVTGFDIEGSYLGDIQCVEGLEELLDDLSNEGLCDVFLVVKDLLEERALRVELLEDEEGLIILEDVNW